ncbi:MAG: carboxypeptidase-like regulatory domain-containing protein [Muribaculaceae bacterium]|nr:carboxypeptidase-like regulatory domain-containing protein [Muribaculaceae bacterium]
MARIITFLAFMLIVFMAEAETFLYHFSAVPLPKAVRKIMEDHPDLDINFIYNELENYKTSAKVNADNPYDALRQVIGLNPITVVKSCNTYYLEALQHGKYVYTGKAIGPNNEPVVAATVMLLAPKDSTVITYGITDDSGCFSIPCDRYGVIGKLSCVGYKTTYRNLNSPSVGTIIMQQHAVALGQVTVEADNSYLYSDKSVYLPTAKQKNAAQTTQDLIVRMAIPQLRIGNEIKTTTGQPVDFFVDFMPASAAEMEGMRIEDVKLIEYYDYPSDPRFQGKPHVINIIMQRYEYGGYTKGIYYDNFIISRQLNGYAKVQYKKMTFDWAGGAYYMNDKKNYENTVETFRLPQEDGSIKEFERNSIVDCNRKIRNAYWTSFKALYRTDNTAISNMVTVDFDRMPKHVTEGKLTYTPGYFESTEYTTRNSNRINSVVYNGYWHFSFSHGNYITFNPYYAYTHTNQFSSYHEVDVGTILNGASDDSHQASGDISFVHSFGKFGTLKTICQGRLLQNMTSYSGSSTMSDKARTYRIGPSVTYSYSDSKFYGLFGFGLYWDKSQYGMIEENTTAPWVNLSLQYAYSSKNSLSFDFNYGKSIPSSGYRSAAVVQLYPLMSYTGNPSLVPYNSFRIDGTYIFIPSNKLSLSAFVSAWIVDNRYVFDYEASSTGILRTIKQPMGKYAQWQYGFQGSIKLIKDRLQLGISCYMEQAHNGIPYNWTKSKLISSISAYYYLDRMYLGATYNTPSGYADGCMVGTWMMPRDSYTFQIGWSNKSWNLRFFTRNFLRYHGYQTKSVMNSQYYDSVGYLYSGSYSGFFQLSATYTFGYGKKVSSDNQAYQATGASSGILK